MEYRSKHVPSRGWRLVCCLSVISRSGWPSRGLESSTPCPSCGVAPSDQELAAQPVWACRHGHLCLWAAVASQLQWGEVLEGRVFLRAPGPPQLLAVPIGWPHPSSGSHTSWGHRWSAYASGVWLFNAFPSAKGFCFWESGKHVGPEEPLVTPCTPVSPQGLSVRASHLFPTVILISLSEVSKCTWVFLVHLCGGHIFLLCPIKDETLCPIKDETVCALSLSVLEGSHSFLEFSLLCSFVTHHLTFPVASVGGMFFAAFGIPSGNASLLCILLQPEANYFTLWVNFWWEFPL